jgi:hypothetical protein
MVFWVLIEVFCGVIRTAIACKIVLEYSRCYGEDFLSVKKKFIFRHILACYLERYSQGQFKGEHSAMVRTRTCQGSYRDCMVME